MTIIRSGAESPYPRGMMESLGCTNKKILVISTYEIVLTFVRDRPFNLKGGGGYGFLFRSEIFFWTTRELEYLFFLSRKARIFFPEFNIRLYDKTLNQIIFFFLQQNQNIFFSNIGNQNIFLEKNHKMSLEANKA